MSRIEFVHQRVDTEWVSIPEGYKFRPAGRLQWLQRAAWRLLGKFGALQQAVEPKFTVTRFSVDTDDFMERLFKQQESLLEGFNRDAGVVLIGGEDFSEMMALPEIRQAISFDSHLYRGDGHGARTIIGLTIKVVPWMRGVLVLPKGFA